MQVSMGHVTEWLGAHGKVLLISFVHQWDAMRWGCKR